MLPAQAVLIYGRSRYDAYAKTAGVQASNHSVTAVRVNHEATNERVVSSLPQALELMLNFHPAFGWIFRGQTNSDWDLRPKAGRAPYYHEYPPDHTPNDINTIREWSRLACAYTSIVPENIFECMAFAQHYGLATRLLDFSSSALVALYFACETSFDDAGAVFAYLKRAQIPDGCNDHTLIKEVSALRVRPFDRRFVVQHSEFLFFPEPCKPLVRKNAGPSGTNKVTGFKDLVKFIIPPKVKLEMHRQLRELGITKRALYPDLQGLSHSFLAGSEWFEARQKEVRMKKA